MKKLWIIVVLLTLTRAGLAQHNLDWMPYLQMGGIYYTSDKLTSDGAGVGVGLVAILDSHYVAQADMNLLWLNGNAVANRFAVGYQKKGTWAPAVFGTFDLLWGHRTEIVSETGERPPSPVWVVGARIAPLRFQIKTGVISVLEFGYGFGPSGGRCLQATLLSVGIKF